MGLRAKSRPRRQSPRRLLGKKPATRIVRGLQIETFEERQLLAVGPQLESFTSDDQELSGGGTLSRSPAELVFSFDTSIDPSTLEGIEITAAGDDGTLGTGDDVVITPGFIGLGQRPNEVLARFTETLPDDDYRVLIRGTGATPLRDTAGEAFNDGADLAIDVDLDLGARITGVVYQPISRESDGSLSQARDEIQLYFNEALSPAFGAGGEEAFFQLIFTGGTATTADDSAPINPTSVSVDASTNRVTLTFADDLENLGDGVARLRVGTSEVPLPAPSLVTPSGDVGSTFDATEQLGTLSDTIVVSEQIASSQFPLGDLTLPGGNDEPGHRDIEDTKPGESHVHGDDQDRIPGIGTFFYNFQSDYGNDPVTGEPLQNLITEQQKDRAREIFEFYGKLIGTQFIEDETAGFTIVTGDPGVLDPFIPSAPGGVGGIAGGSLAIMDAAENWGASEFGGAWFQTAMHEIGHLLRFAHAYDLPPLTIMGAGGDQAVPGVPVEPIFPGDTDLIHGEFLHFNDNIDVDLYSFAVDSPGVFSAEIIAERMGVPSLLDSVLVLYDSDFNLIARNDDYFSEDSFIELEIDTPGVYYIGVHSTGLEDLDPTIADSGIGGTTQGAYDLRLNFRPELVLGEQLLDAEGTPIDGDGDGTPGGVFNFWFDVEPESETLFVDKLTPGTGGTPGSLANPLGTISAAIAAAQPGSGISLIRIVGNGGADEELTTLEDNVAYQVGRDASNNPLADGATLAVPRDVTVTFEAGAMVKLQSANITAGSETEGVNRSGAAIQVLGTPEADVIFTSALDETVGFDTNPVATEAEPGNWGGLVFRNDIDRAAGQTDLEAEGIFLNFIAQGDFRFGGGDVVVDSVSQVFTAVHLIESRPTVIFSRMQNNSSAPVSADPNSFEETLFGDDSFAADYRRIGPAIYGLAVDDNGINGLLVRTATPANPGELITNRVAARWNDHEIVHVVTENLRIEGTPGGPERDGGGSLVARLDGRLAIDPGVIVKLGGTRIESEIGTQFLAEATAGRRTIFTSLFDDEFGAGGTFDTSADGAASSPAAGDWGGLFFGHLSSASLDHVELTYAGGVTSIEGGFAQFNAVEIHQADVRMTHSILRDNADGQSDGDLIGQDINRNGRGFNSPAAIFVRGAQPVIVDNIIRDNLGAAININVNALNHEFRVDPGRSIGPIDRFDEFDENRGALIQENVLDNNELNALGVRGGVLTTQVVWDDTDIVHAVAQPIEVQNHHTFSGLRFESSPGESLVVKLFGTEAGFTAKGTPFEIDDRIGGSIQVIGQPSAPVVFTALSDDNAGAGFNLAGSLQTDTDNVVGTPVPGSWGSIRLETFSNDRNVETVLENELPQPGGIDTNAIPLEAQFLGELAPALQSGDENRRLGFEVNGFISLDDPTDVDVYSFQAQGGTEVWLDLDQTGHSLDSVIELIDANGDAIARSDNSANELKDPSLLDGLLADNLARTMQRDAFSGQDFFTTNPRDAGLRVVLPGPVGTVSTYFVRVRSNSDDLSDLDAGETSGEYKLQIRLQEADEVPGSTVRFADIRFATNGIEIIGAPFHSPLIGDAAFASTSNNSFATAQDLGNLLASDRGSLSVAGLLTDPTEANWFKFTLDFEGIQSIEGFNDFDGTYATVFDIDYADGTGGPDTTISVFDENGTLVLVAQDGKIDDDQPRPAQGADTDNPDGGSFGTLDAFLGSVQLPEGTEKEYFVAVSPSTVLPTQLDQFVVANPANPLVRVEPITTFGRAAHDRVGADGGATLLAPEFDLFSGPNPIDLNAHAVPFQLNDVNLFVNSQAELFAVDPFNGLVETEITDDIFPNIPPDNGISGFRDIVMRDDARLFGMTIGADDGSSGNFSEISTGNGAILSSSDDGIGTGQADVGVQFEALAFSSAFGNLFAVGNFPGGGSGITRNILFQLDPNTGGTVFDDARDPAEPFNVIEQGNIDTSLEDPSIVGIKVTAGDLIDDGDLFEVTDAFGMATFEMDAGFVIQVPAGGAASIVDGDSFDITFVDFDAQPPSFESRNFIFDVAPLSLVPGQDERIIPILPQWNETQVANAIASVVNEEVAALGLAPAVVIGDQVFIGGDDRHSVTVGGGPIILSGTPGVALGNEIVSFTPNDSSLTVAESVADAINAAVSINVSAETFEDIVALDGLNVVVDLPVDADPTNDTQFTLVPGRVDGGLVTGIAFVNGTMFAVSDGGGFYSVNAGNAETTLIAQHVDAFGNPINFQGLAPGPVNAGGGQFADMIFAVDATGNLYAMDETGTLQTIFDTNFNGTPDSTSVQLTNSDGSPLVSETGIIRGLDFTPFDINLWHVTERRSDDPGHGLSPTFDNDVDRLLNIGGGQSFWFGIEDPRGNGSLPDQPGTGALIGQNRNEGLFNTFAAPGGTFGSLVTNTFDLTGYSPNDRPTLYFNYYLETEGANSAIGALDAMRDSLRVFISDDGVNWDQLGTNNSLLKSIINPAELPEFLSFSEQASFDEDQQVQELFDNTNSWRQARIPLGNFAGLDNLQLRFDFATAGEMEEAGLESNEFGNFGSNTRGQNNLFEGAFLDDVVIGFAERGEMVTAATPGATSTFVLPQDPTPDIIPTAVGPYQLEIRRGTAGATSGNVSGALAFITKTATFDTNERFGEIFTMRAPGGPDLIDGATFFINDGVNLVTFEFDSGGGFNPDNVPIPFTDLDSEITVAAAIVAAINGVEDLESTASTTGTDDRVELFTVSDAGINDPPEVPGLPTTALDDYVLADDPSFAWTPDPVIVGADFTAAVIDLTSQTWRTTTDVAETVWQHNMVVVTPTGVPLNPNTATLFITGGNSNDPKPTTANDIPQEIVDIAIATRSIVVVLPTVPNQPLDFTAEAGTFSEDAAIAFTFDQFLQSGTTDVEWPLLLPMVKSAFAAMDATEEFLGNADMEFIVTGGSKRGWTTYLTAAVDQNLPEAEQRVIGIAPIVFDFLNFNDQLAHHKAHFEGVTDFVIDGFSIALADYIERDLPNRFRGADGLALLSIVDPFSYRERFADIPKFLIHSTGDEFFVPDSTQFYLDDLPGETFLRYVPNTGHSSVGDDGRAFDNFAAFFNATVAGVDMPDFSWEIPNDNTIIVTTEDAPLEVKLWTAENPINRDFRDGGGLGPEWFDEVLTEVTPGTFVAQVEPPVTGAKGMVVELSFANPAGGDPLVFTTEVTFSSAQPLNEDFAFDIDRVERMGDTNIPREQGQLFIQSNTITGALEYGILVAADTASLEGKTEPGAVRVLPTLHNTRDVPGITIENNIIAFNQVGGIQFGGDGTAAELPAAARPFGHLTNNTIYGGLTAPQGIGINVVDNASPTLLNNIVSNFNVGIQIDPTSLSTVVGGTVYKNNTQNTNIGALGSFPLALGAADPLFINPAAGDFNLQQGSLAIDSSVEALQERASLAAVLSPLDILPSPILAPDLDRFGRVRKDDPNTIPPPGLGANVFKDRGAVERSVSTSLPTISIDDITLIEGNSGSIDAVFTVSAEGLDPAADPVTVDFTTTPGTATTGVDFSAVTGTLTFVAAPGESSAEMSITVPILGDLEEESDETFFVDLSNAQGAVVIKSRGQGTIIDNDSSTGGPLTVSVGDESFLEGQQASTIVRVPVFLSQPAGALVTVNYATSNGTAIAGSDYNPRVGSLTFQPGEFEKDILIQILGDTAIEPDETFFVTLSNPVGATLGQAIGTVTILDDDGAPAPLLVDPGSLGTSEGSTLSQQISATNPGGFPLLYSLAPGAPAGASIDPQTGVVSWTPSDNLPQPATLQVMLHVEGDSTPSDAAFVPVSVDNVAPVAALSAPPVAVAGYETTVTLNAVDASIADAAAGFTFEIDWDNDGVTDETVVGPNGTLVSHFFDSVGIHEIGITATDKDGGQSSLATASVDVRPWALLPDAEDPSLTNLVWGGTNGVDVIGFISGTPGSVFILDLMRGNVLVNELSFVTGITGRIIGDGRGAPDLLAADMLRGTRVEFYGGEGEDALFGGDGADMIHGGAGPDLVVGGVLSSDGADLLTGGDDNDVIYGHLGADTIDGGAGEDLLLGDKLDRPELTDALFDIATEWRSSRDYATKIENITGVGTGPKKNKDTFIIPGTTVFADNEVDTITGGADLDWFIYTLLEDLAQDPQADEEETTY